MKYLRSIPLLSILGLAGLCAALPGCGDVPHLEDEPLDTLEQELSSPINTTCTQADLGVTATTCSGPWAYQEWNTCSAQHADCGTYCPQWPSCHLWENGVAPATRTTGSQGSRVAQKCTKTWVKSAEQAGAWELIGTSCPAVTRPSGFCDAAARQTQLGAWFQADLADAPFTHSSTHKFGVYLAGAAIITLPIPLYSTSEGAHSTRVSGRHKYETWNVNEACSFRETYPVKVYAANQQCGACAVAMATHTCTLQRESCGKANKHTLPAQQRPEKFVTVQGIAQNAVSAVSCTTKDDLPFDNVPQVASKYVALKSALDGPAQFAGSPADQVEPLHFKRAIAARLQLLLELRGHLLSEDQRNVVRATYANPDYNLCRADIGVATCQAELAAFLPKLRMCANLGVRWSQSGNAALNLASELGQHAYCLEAFRDVATVASPTCRGVMRDAVARLTLPLMDAQFRQLSFNAVTSRFSNMNAVLAAIDLWYGKAQLAAPVVVPADATSVANLAWLRAQTSPVLTRFWSRANDSARQLPTTIATDLTAEDQLAEVAGASLIADVEVLAGLFESTLETPPLLALTADALHGLFLRLEDASAMHDLATRYRKGLATRTLTSEAWRLIASLPDRVGLLAAVTESTELHRTNGPGGAVSPAAFQIHTRLHHAFAQLAQPAAHERLARAFAADGNPGGLAALLSNPSLSPAAAGLGTLVGTARQRYEGFRRSGQFLGDIVRTLDHGLQNRATMVTELTGKANKFDEELALYKSKRFELADSLLRRLRGEGTVQVTIDRMSQLGERIADAGRKLAVFRHAEDEQRDRAANELDHFLGATAHLTGVGGPAQSLGTIAVRASMARFSPSGSRLPSVIGVQQGGNTWRQTLAQGEAIKLRVTNSWSPSCALAQSHYAPTAQNPSPVIGPEGYRLSWSETGFRTETFARERSMTSTASVEACVKAGYGGGPAAGAFGVNFEVYVKACLSASLSATKSKNWQHGTESRESATFAGGLFLDNTPYPEAPAGALLLVTTEPGQPSRLVDVQVVGPDAAYLAERAVDVYLVVNDLSCPLSSDPALTVDAWITRPTGLLIAQLGGAMAEATARLRSKASELAAQGKLLQAQELELRQEIRTTIQTRTGRDITQLPAPAQDYLEYWTTSVIVSLYRRIEIVAQEREIHLALLENDAVGRELATAQGASRLEHLMERWQLRDLRRNRMAVTRARLVRYLRDHVPPIFELRYPSAVVSLLSPDGAESVAADLVALEHLDFATSQVDIDETIGRFADKVVNALVSANNDDRTYGPLMVAVAIPRPETYTSAGTPEGCGLLGPCQEGGLASVDLGTAQAVWNAILAPNVADRKAEITITPADLYFLDGDNGQARLDCTAGAPVIQKFAIVLETPVAMPVDTNFASAVKLSAQTLFTLAEGIVPYNIPAEDLHWLGASVPVLSANATDAVGYVKTHAATAFAGLSPFNTYDLNLSSYVATYPMANVSRLLLVWQLEYLTVPEGVGIEGCRTPVGP